MGVCGIIWGRIVRGTVQETLNAMLEAEADRIYARRVPDRRNDNSPPQQLLHAFAMWTITLRHSPLLPSMQSEAMTLAMMQRIATAIDDLDSLDSV